MAKAHRAAIYGSGATSKVRTPPWIDADLAFAGLARHAELIAAGELSSRELTELFLARIARLDPLLNAFRVVLGEQALAEADQADGRRRAGDTRPLLGVPIAIKDDIHVAGEVTALRLRRRPAARSPPTPRSCARLRAAGAVIIGKTHVPELMATAFTESPTFGVTRNPWDLHRTSGGSSGGSRDRGRRRAGRAPRSAPTAPARSASRPPAAGCSALKPQRGRISTAPDVDPHQRHDRLRPAHAHGRGRGALHGRRPGRRAVASPRPPRRRPGRLRIAVSIGLPPLGVKPDAEQLAGVRVDRGSCCASSATRWSSASSTGG